MTVSSRLALAMVLLVVLTSCVVSAFAYYFVSGASPHAVLTAIIGAALAGGAIAAVFAIALAVGTTKSLSEPQLGVSGTAKVADIGSEPEHDRAYQALADREQDGAGHRRKRARRLRPDRRALCHPRLEPARRGPDGMDAGGGGRQERGGTGLSGSATPGAPAMGRPLPERGRGRRGRRALRNAAVAQGRARILRRGVADGAAPRRGLHHQRLRQGHHRRSAPRKSSCSRRRRWNRSGN